MKIYPVVHVQSSEHAVRLTEQALGAGADGVFLIDHTGQPPEYLTGVYHKVRRHIGREAFIGVNYLGAQPSEAIRMADNDSTKQVDAVWSDDAVAWDWLYNIPALKRDMDIEYIKYFGGVAFKYTPSYTDDPQKAADLAKHYANAVDVMTTSGPGTGYAAGVEKVAAMKEAIGKKELALASGISLENIDLYKRYVDYALVASSIETSPYSGEFVISKLNELIWAAHRM